MSSAALAADNPRIAGNTAYPLKPVRVVIGFPAAGSSDIMARIVGQKLSERYGQPFIGDNRPGAAGNLAAEIAARAAPDGYTLVVISVISIGPSVTLYPHMSIDPLKDFEYISLIAVGSYVIVAHPSFPAKTIPELVALAKKQPGKIGYATSGVGGPVHLAGELLKSRAGIDLLHVPYKGAGPIMNAVAGKEVALGLPSVAGGLPMIKSGRVVPIAVMSSERSGILPDVPTIAESGYPGYDMTPRWGFAAPAGTPSTIVRGLSAEVNAILKMPEVKSALGNQGLDATGSTPERFREIVRETIEVTRKLITDVGIKAN